MIVPRTDEEVVIVADVAGAGTGVAVVVEIVVEADVPEVEIGVLKVRTDAVVVETEARVDVPEVGTGAGVLIGGEIGQENVVDIVAEAGRVNTSLCVLWYLLVCMLLDIY